MVDIDCSALTLSFGEILLRFLAAMLIGVIIGGEREWTHRPAGMRTHMLVSLGACAVMITSQMIFAQYRAYGATPDPARLSAQVISGVGFLGAGTILREGVSIKGLTTAASVWTVACLGIAVGGGYYAIGFAGMACILITLIFFEQLQKKLFNGRDTQYNFCVTSTDVVAALDRVNELSQREEAAITSMHVTHRDDGKMDISFRADFSGRHSAERRQTFFAGLNADESTIAVKTDRTRM